MKIQWIELGVVSLLFSQASFGMGCLEKHITDGIVSNQARAPLYSAWTNGASEKLSESLWKSEKLVLPVVREMDRMAEPFNAAGVPLLCADIESMQSIAPFSNSPRPVSESFRNVKGLSVWRDTFAMLWAAHHKNFAKVSVLATEYLNQLEDHSYNCSTRHFLQSIVRGANMAPIHAEEAIQAGLNPKRDCKFRSCT